MMILRNFKFIKTTTVFAGLIAMLVYLFAPASAAQTNTSTTNAAGSYLGVVGQVVPPSSSGTVNSTDAISSNDTVRWTNYFSSRLPSPFKSDGSMTLPSNFTWVIGSIVAPSNVTLRWKVGGIWKNTEPANGTVVTHVGWTINPLYTIKVQPAVSSLVNFQGTGDGYRVITYKDRIYVVNHHAGTNANYLNCRKAVDGTPCLGYETDGKRVSTVAGKALAPYESNEMVTPNRSIEHLDLATGNLFIYVATGQNIYMLCANLDTNTSCMNAYYMDTGTENNEKAVNVLGSIGSKYYAISSNRSQVLCFDVSTKSKCVGYPVDQGWGGADSIAMSFVANHYIIYGLDGVMRCFDTVSRQGCAGWGSNLLSSGKQVFPALNPDGTIKGACSVAGCRLLNGTAFTPTPEHAAFINQNQFFYSVLPSGYSTAGIYGSRVFQALSGEISPNYTNCFDFATNSGCSNFPLNTANGAGPKTYSINKDLVRPNCYWTLGDEALAKSFDPRTGGDCPAASVVPPTILLNIDPITNYQCDGSRARINKWGQIRFSPALTWGANGLTSVKARLMDWNGVVLPNTLNPNRVFANGAYTLDISDIPFSSYQKLKVELTLEAGNRTLDAEVAFDITWDGDPAQLCFKTKAPVLDTCQIDVAVVQDNAAVHTPNTTERLNATTGLTPGNQTDSWGPTIASSTLRQYPAGSSDPTQILQTRFRLSDLTGDLWQYPLLADYSLALNPSSKASTITSGRTFYTSTPNSSGPWARIPLTYSALSAAQQASVNVGLSGAVDTLGAQRIAYLTGSTTSEVSNGGTLRNRASALGTAIDSAPTVLDRVALAGYSDGLYPNYTAFRQTLSRQHKLAFYAGNDGLLHAYKVQAGALVQAFSYMPSILLKDTTLYTDKTLPQARLNPYWLDNTPMVADVNLGASVTDNQWRSVVVGNQGRGGRGVYAIDVTSGNLDKVLFEYDNTSDPDLKDLGYVLGQPPSDRVTGADQIVRMNDGRWAYVTGNGVNSNLGGASGGTGTAALYIFYLNGSTGGPKWRKIPVNTTGVANAQLDTANGLSNPRPVDVDGDGKVDLIYAGDIKGNLWRFDVRNLNSVTVTKLFQTAAGQPIHTAPVATRLNQSGTCPSNGVRGCWMVTVGTGEPMNPLTNTNSTVTQSVYGIFDKGDTGAAALVLPTQLVSHTLVSNAPTAAGVVTRSVVNAPVSFSNTIRGWKLVLSAAEHVSSNPVLQANGAVAFGSSRPSGASAASCAAKDSWITFVNPINGAGAVASTIGNGSSVAVGGSLFSVTQTLGKGGLNSPVGTVFLPGLRSALVSSLNGGIDVNSQSMIGRLSWREVFGAPR